ncbi:MAG: sulfatase [Pseudonocardiales bacterium]|nr:MAG: sulfatase [Pseudonocardiales bacterium]
MTRSHRTWHVLTAVAAAGLLLAGCTWGGSAHKAVATRPNIVFVLTDDLAPNLLPYLPHVQAMQKAGSTMSNYYVVDSLCCPSRTAIFTGEYPHDDGVFTNSGNDGGYDAFVKHGNDPKTFAVATHKAGYRTGFMGKYLNRYQPTDPVPQGWDEWDGTGNAYKEFNYQLNENGTVHRYGKDPKDYLTDVVSRKAVSFIDGSAAAGKPFVLEVATFAPHRPSIPAPRDAHRFPGLTAPRTPAYDALPTGAPAWLQRIPPLTPRDTADMDHEYRKRAQSVIAVDDMIGRIQQELRAKGLADNTYLVFSSDNGYHMGEHRMRPGKMTAFDTDIKVPLVVTGPGVPSGSTVSQLASSIDLAPTFETIGGARVPPTVDGTSLLPLWHGSSPPGAWQQAVLVEHHGPEFGSGDPDTTPAANGNPPTYAAIRTATSLFVQYDSGERELYDTTIDPDELHNLAGPAALARAAPLQHTLTALVNCHNAAACQAAARI